MSRGNHDSGSEGSNEAPTFSWPRPLGFVRWDARCSAKCILLLNVFVLSLFFLITTSWIQLAVLILTGVAYYQVKERKMHWTRTLVTMILIIFWLITIIEGLAALGVAKYISRKHHFLPHSRYDYDSEDYEEEWQRQRQEQVLIAILKVAGWIGLLTGIVMCGLMVVLRRAMDSLKYEDGDRAEGLELRHFVEENQGSIPLLEPPVRASAPGEQPFLQHRV